MPKTVDEANDDEDQSETIAEEALNEVAQEYGVDPEELESKLDADDGDEAEPETAADQLRQQREPDDNDDQPSTRNRIRQATLQESQNRREETVDLGNGEKVVIKSRSKNEIQKIGDQARALAGDTDTFEEQLPTDADLVFERLLIIECTYDQQGNQVYDFSDLPQFGKVQEQADSWYDRLSSNVSYLHGWITDAPPGNQSHVLNVIQDKAEEYREAVHADDRLDEDLSSEIAELFREFEAMAKEATPAPIGQHEAENLNLL